MSYPTYAVLSFDAMRDAAERESREDRSLNLLLRQRKVRSEIFRLQLDPAPADVELLATIFESTPPRPLIVIARDPKRFPAQEQAIRRFREFATAFILVRVAPQDAPAEGKAATLLFDIPADDAPNMHALADAIADYALTTLD